MNTSDDLTIPEASPKLSIPGSMPDPPRIGVLGVGGFAGGELVRLLLRHPRLETASPSFYGRAGTGGDDGKMLLSDVHPHLSAVSSSKTRTVVPFDWDDVAGAGIELLFLATPHEQSRQLVPEALARGIKVIDLSGAWRLKDAAHRKVYQLNDQDTALAASIQAEAVYGCPELHRDEIRTARLIANPGCYATSIILALAPLIGARVVNLDCGIVCDAKSGVSGAGKAATATTHFMYAADNLSAYSVFGHRHTGELLEQLGLDGDQIQFTPHLLPIPRGILSTIYLKFARPTRASDVSTLFDEFYRQSPMVRLRQSPELPQIQHVVRTNFCDLGFEVSADGKKLVVVSCLDNLLKGAAGQAIQNMNLMWGWKEEEGLL